MANHKDFFGTGAEGGFLAKSRTFGPQTKVP